MADPTGLDRRTFLGLSSAWLAAGAVAQDVVSDHGVVPVPADEYGKLPAWRPTRSLAPPRCRKRCGTGCR